LRISIGPLFWVLVFFPVIRNYVFVRSSPFSRKRSCLHSLQLDDTFLDAFQGLGFVGSDSAGLLVRTQLLMEVKKEILSRGWSQAKAAEELQVKQPRISEIMRLRIDKFSAELLVKYLSRLGKKVQVLVD
jgi:predicted XRE-type DNA-binding protein